MTFSALTSTSCKQVGDLQVGAPWTPTRMEARMDTLGTIALVSLAVAIAGIVNSYFSFEERREWKEQSSICQFSFVVTIGALSVGTSSSLMLCLMSICTR